MVVTSGSSSLSPRDIEASKPAYVGVIKDEKVSKSNVFLG